MKHGFDSTSFPSANHFAKVLAMAGIMSNAVPTRDKIGSFIWQGKDIEIVTGNNPITGEYSQPNRREPEIGYASYIGVEGKDKTVIAVVLEIKKQADFIKDESVGERDFI